MKLVYINPDCYVDTDLNVLKYLVKDFDLVWYPVYYPDRKIYVSAEQMKAYAEKYGIELHLCPRQYRQRDPRNLQFYDDIVADINAHEPHIVYSCITEELWWTLASKRLKTKGRVLGVHDAAKHSDSNRIKRAIQGWIHSYTIKHNKYFCVFSESQRQLFREIYHRDAKVLGLGSMDLGHSDLVPPSVSSGIRLLFFGNIVKYKGLDLLISALEKLRAEGIGNISLTVAGRGDYWEICKDLVKTKGMYDLRIRFIENREVPDLFSSHHFLALPYRDATQSGPVSIAANYGLPIFAPEYGCFKEQYDKSAALLYTDLEQGLKRLSKMNEDEYGVLRLNASKEKERNSAEAIGVKYVEFLSAIVKKSGQ